MSYPKLTVRSLFLLLLFPFLLKAQTYPFINYGVQDGLSQSNVSAIVQDKSGFIWMATEGGISKFDGKNFTNYTTGDGLADNNVSCLLLDKNGILWLGHETGSLSKFDGKTFTAIRSEALPKNKPVYGLYEDKNGGLWISTSSTGAIHLKDPAKGFEDKTNYKVYGGPEGLGQYVIATVQDPDKNTWFLTDLGVKIMDAKSGKIEFFKPSGMVLGQITALSQNKNGDILLGAANGSILKHDAVKKETTVLLSPELFFVKGQGFSPNVIYSIYEDGKGTLWASVIGKGIVRFSPSEKKITFFNSDNGLQVNKIKCITEDREGNMLFGTLGEGVEVFKGEKFISFSKKDGLVNNQVWSICQDMEGNYWFGTNEGISVYDAKQEGEKAFKSVNLMGVLGNNNVRSLTRDKAGNLWIGTWGGKIAKYDAQKKTVGRVDAINDVLSLAFVSCLMVDSKNRLWAGTADGLAMLDINSGKASTFRTLDGLGDNDISCLFEDSKGWIYVGTRKNGISVYDGKGFKIIGNKEGLTYSSITSITEDKQNALWIGTEGGGAFVYKDNAFINYKTKDGLVSDFITLVNLDNSGNIWLGTNKGLSKFDAGKKMFLSYASNEGFAGIEAKPKAVFNDNSGNVWFGTVNGVFKYNPALDVPNALPPLTQLTRFRVNLNDKPLNEEIKLSYKDNSLNFDFIGISLSNPDEVKYKVKLEGYDEDWKPASKNNFEIYSNLPHGNYVFKLIACNSAGVCNADPVEMKITITPPFWKTWWFYVLVIIIGLAIMFTYIKIRERSLILEKKILEQKVEERTAEVVEKNKELDEKNKDITASIRYAKRIQDAILPPDEFVKKFLPKTFVLFKPKDIVSGDFYWLADKKDMVLFAAVDCTGHGVPGAFMSIVGHNLLDQIVGEHGLTQPAAILDMLNKSVSDTLRQSYTEDNSIRDGMDISICSFDRRTNTLDYAGAYNPLWLIRNGEFTEIKANKFPIGNLKAGENKKFTNHSIPLQPGDTLYIFSDGFADQFGGPGGKKFKYSSFKQILLDTQHMSMEEQGEHIHNVIEDWRGTLEQVDDILVIGTRL